MLRSWILQPQWYCKLHGLHGQRSITAVGSSILRPLLELLTCAINNRWLRRWPRIGNGVDISCDVFSYSRVKITCYINQKKKLFKVAAFHLLLVSMATKNCHNSKYYSRCWCNSLGPWKTIKFCLSILPRAVAIPKNRQIRKQHDWSIACTCRFGSEDTWARNQCYSSVGVNVNSLTLVPLLKVT